MVANLEARLAKSPDDLEGWLMLARSRGVMGNSQGAADAFRRAQALAANDPGAIGGLGEALTDVAGGVVTPEAKSLFTRLGEVEPRDPRTEFYLGWAEFQAGDNKAALERWQSCSRRAPADAPWRPRVVEAIQAAATELQLDPAAMLAQVPTPPAPRVSQPSAEDVAAAQAMPAEDRMAMIRGMVEKLQARMDADGSDVEGWLRLAQSRLVLGENDRARATFEQALTPHPDEPALLKGYGGTLLGPVRADTGLPEVGDQANELFTKAASLQPDDPELWWFLGVRALQDGRKAEARAPGRRSWPGSIRRSRSTRTSRAGSTASAADGGIDARAADRGLRLRHDRPAPDLADLDRALGRIEDTGASHAELELFAADLIAGGRVLPGPRRRLERAVRRRRLGYTAHGTLASTSWTRPTSTGTRRSAGPTWSWRRRSAPPCWCFIRVHPVRPAQSWTGCTRSSGRLARDGRSGRTLGSDRGRDAVRRERAGIHGRPGPARGGDPGDRITPHVVGTLDVSHSYLMTSFRGTSFTDAVAAFAPVTGHFHLHDSFGRPPGSLSGFYTDSERLAFGVGDLHLPFGWGDIPFESLLPDCRCCRARCSWSSCRSVTGSSWTPAPRSPARLMERMNARRRCRRVRDR